MTGRRSIASWDARISRALQFVPGHVSGRVASAQPINRWGGTIRQPIGAMAVAVNACGVDYPRTSLGATTAHFNCTDPFGFVALDISVDWTAASATRIRIASIDPNPGDPPSGDYTPTAWVSIGPGSGTTSFISIAGGGTINGYTVEWEDSGAVTSTCAAPIPPE